MRHLTLEQFQAVVGEWAAKTFPASTPESILKHLRDEVDELLGSVTDGSPEPMEAADCLILLVQFAHRMGWDLLEFSERKHEINLNRKWGAPDARGVVRHVDESDCPACGGDGEESDPRIPSSICSACHGTRKVLA